MPQTLAEPSVTPGAHRCGYCGRCIVAGSRAYRPMTAALQRPPFANTPMDDEVAPIMAAYGVAVASPNDLLWHQTGSTLSAHKAGNEVMRPSIPAFAATDADIYERFMGRWSARMADPFLSFA